MPKITRPFSAALLLCWAGTWAGIWAGTGLAAETIEVFQSSPAAIVNMQPLALHIGGRVQLQGAERYAHQWPGVYFEGTFQGTAVTIRFDDSVTEYRLQIDGAAPKALAQPGPVDIRITGLADTNHRIRIEKITESTADTGVFGGLYIPITDQPGTALPRTRQIEFIGDSDMTGYGIRSASRDCTDEQVRLLSDTQAAYPALVGRHFDADYQINAISGRGLVRNYDGFNPELAMITTYDQTLFWDPAPYDNPDWSPQIIVVALGGNDFATPLHKGEAWTTPAALIADFTSAYTRFLTRLHNSHPGATILILMPYGYVLPQVQTPGFTAAFQTALLTTAGQIGLTRLDFLTLTEPPPALTACGFHPSAQDQQTRADWLIRYLSDHPSLWTPQ